MPPPPAPHPVVAGRADGPARGRYRRPSSAFSTGRRSSHTRGAGAASLAEIKAQLASARPTAACRGGRRGGRGGGNRGTRRTRRTASAARRAGSTRRVRALRRDAVGRRPARSPARPRRHARGAGLPRQHRRGDVTSATSACRAARARASPSRPRCPSQNCDLVGNPFDDALSPAQRQSVDFANFAATLRQRTGGAIVVETVMRTDAARSSIRSRARASTAGEWNAVAAQNNRVEFRRAHRAPTGREPADAGRRGPTVTDVLPATPCRRLPAAGVARQPARAVDLPEPAVPAPGRGAALPRPARRVPGRDRSTAARACACSRSAPRSRAATRPRARDAARGAAARLGRQRGVALRAVARAAAARTGASTSCASTCATTATAITSTRRSSTPAASPRWSARCSGCSS